MAFWIPIWNKDLCSAKDPIRNKQSCGSGYRYRIHFHFMQIRIQEGKIWGEKTEKMQGKWKKIVILLENTVLNKYGQIPLFICMVTFEQSFLSISTLYEVR